MRGRCGLLILCALAAGIAGGGGGCAVPGVIAYKVFGPPAIPARYTPQQQPMLVLIERYDASSGIQPETEELTQALHRELKRNKVAPLINPGALHVLRDQRRGEFAKMTIADVGRAAGAEQVLYVDVREFVVSSPGVSIGEMIQGRMSARVKVIDTATGNARWPELGDGEAIEFQTPYTSVRDRRAEGDLRQSLIQQSAGHIARMFYKYKPETMSEENAEE